MSRILVIESSARQSGSVSRSLSADFIAQWQLANPQDQVIVRDVAGSRCHIWISICSAAG